jgi:hypothetical protein
MFLLPGSLPTDRATLRALCEGLPANAELAKWFLACDVEAVDGSWSDGERSALLPPEGVGTVAVERTAHLTQTAFATPLHAALGFSDLTPLDPAQLQLTEDESRALCEASDALMREEGVHLEFVTAQQWRVVCERNIEVLTERTDWIIGESLRPNLPRGPDARLIERWMNELQMLLFNHSVNIARTARGLPPVNVIWLWGFDGLRPRVAHASNIDGRMLAALRSGDLASWQQAWRDLTAQIVASDAIVLGDARPRLRLTKRPATIASKLRWMFATPSLSDTLSSVQAKSN